jgi:hypothetical protein
MRVIEGGRAPRRIGSLVVHEVRADEALPFTVDAIVTEQDTWLALAPSREVLVEDANPLRTHTRARDVEPLALGTVDVVHSAGRQAIVRAIVVDVDADPCCTARAVEDAMRAAIKACRARGIRSLRVPLLGTAHGRLGVEESVAAIERAFVAASDGEALEIAVVR